MADDERSAGPLQEVPTNAELPAWTAAWDSFWGVNISFYPLVVDGDEPKSLDSDAVIRESMSASQNWGLLRDGGDLDAASKFARESLTEVTKQTEYQDQKATRLLTVTTFLSAFAGVLFTRFQDAYPIVQPLLPLRFSFEGLLIFLTYAAFIAFILAALLGALVIFHATRTRFNYPKYTKVQATAPPKSLLFFAGIIRARPSTWMDAWVEDDSTKSLSGGVKVHPNLKREYYRSLVLETYLVAAKTADKLRYLQPAQQLLAVSLRILLVWLLLLMVTTAFVASTKAVAKPTEVKLVEPIALPAPSVVVEVPSPPPPTPPQPPAKTDK